MFKNISQLSRLPRTWYGGVAVLFFRVIYFGSFWLDILSDGIALFSVAIVT